jgi:putative transcriptional regulator
MTIHHHPPDELLTAFAAGILDLGQHIAIATHLVQCPHCRASVRAMEHVGGAILVGMTPTEMSIGAFATVEARLGEVALSAATKSARGAAELADVPGLPRFVRSYPAGSWKWIAPKMLCPIRCPRGA